jgi:GTP-binding protein
LRITAEFVTSAAGPADFPADGRPEIAFVGRSNVGKSSLLNALLRQRVARTSAAPGKTRLANIYRVSRGSSAPFYFVDLPGYGYARGGEDTARAFEALTHAYFGVEPQTRRSPPGHRREPAAILLVDARHPGLENDLEAWAWLRSRVKRRVLVGTKVDKLARGQRIRALRELESVFDEPVLPVSAVTGEGLDELWKLIDSLGTSPNSSSNRARRPPRPTRATAP